MDITKHGEMARNGAVRIISNPKQNQIKSNQIKSKQNKKSNQIEIKSKQKIKSETRL